MQWSFALLLLAVTIQIEAYQMTRCQLLAELRKHGFPENKMRDWMCLVQNESGRRTDLVGKMNRNGSRDYGLFQINDKYWCSKDSTPGKDCHVTCNDLLTDDITKAATCAKKIFKRHGFWAWYGWRNHCQRNLPQLPSC